MNQKYKSYQKICIYAVGHKYFQLPINDSMHVPLLVGKRHDILPAGYLTDCVGDNIAYRNQRYNELTGLYWIWKNSQFDIVGLCHYRRYFTTAYGKIKNLFWGDCSIFIQEKRIIQTLQTYDLILHNKTFMTVGNQNQLCAWGKNHETSENGKLSKEILKLTNEIFWRMYPEDLQIYEMVMKRKYAHLLNVMICRKELLDRYCKWLFPLLFAIEEELERQFPNDAHERCLGLLGERFLDVWVTKERLRVKECFTFNTEKREWKMW